MVAMLPAVVLVGAIVWQLALAGHVAVAVRERRAGAALVRRRSAATPRRRRAARCPGSLERGLRVARTRRPVRVTPGPTSRAAGDSPSGRPRRRCAGRARSRLAAPLRGAAPARTGQARHAERGQASVELLGALPAVLLTGLVVFQLLALGYSKVLAGNAAEAGALAVAGGGEARGAARAAVPGWSRARMRVDVERRAGAVRMRPPSPLRAVARALEVEATAAVDP